MTTVAGVACTKKDERTRSARRLPSGARESRLGRAGQLRFDVTALGHDPGLQERLDSASTRLSAIRCAPGPEWPSVRARRSTP